MKTQIGVFSIILLLLFSSSIVLISPVTHGEQPSWPTSWVLADIDPNEAETNKDYRDVQNAYYYINNEYLYFRLECYGYPNFTAEPNTRFKWFIDTDDPYNMAWQGGNVYEDDFLLFIEGPHGKIYLLYDVDGDGIIDDDWPDYKITPGPITDTIVAGYRIIDHYIDIYISQAEIGNPIVSYFTWSTDQGNPNLDSTSSNDRSDAYWLEDLMKADLDVVITDSPDPVYPGDVLTYTLQVTNYGPHNATEVSVKNILPDDVTFIGALPSQESLIGQTAWWNFTSLTIGASQVITINVMVNSDSSPGIITDTTVVYNETRDPLPGNNIANADTTVCLPPDTQPPSNATGLIVEDAKDGKLNLSWDPSTDNIGVDHYEIFRDGLFLYNVTNLTYQDTGLTIGQEYVYEVRAVDAAGNRGGFSDPVSGTSTKTITHGGGSSGGSNDGENNQGSTTQNTTEEENNTNGSTSRNEYTTALAPPYIDGPIEGFTNITYTFNISSNNTGITLKYTIIWGDEHSNNSDFLASDAIFMSQHQWAHPGEYNISVTASDEHRDVTSYTAIIITSPPSSTITNLPYPDNYFPWFFDFLLILLILLIAYLILRRVMKEKETKIKK